VSKLHKNDVAVEIGLVPVAEEAIAETQAAAPAPLVRSATRPMRGDAAVKETKVLFGCKVSRR